MKTPPVVLTIAGFDPSGGAGITADIKTIAAHGCYGAACVTALTVQSTQGVRSVEAVSPSVVRTTLDELARDLEFAAVKIGMLGTADIVEAVADFLKEHLVGNIVLDPILKSSSGARLLEAGGEQQFRERLLPQVRVVTPNINEAEALTGIAVREPEDMIRAAGRLHELGPEVVVVTGGHLALPVDLLSVAGQVEEFPTEKIESRSTHGTGCAFSTALACQLAWGRSIRDAVAAAQAYVRGAILGAYPLGRGTGPVNHLWNVWPKITH